MPQKHEGRRWITRPGLRLLEVSSCGLKLEGIVSKRGEAPYAPGNRGLWPTVKCLNREEFAVVGWTA